MFIKGFFYLSLKDDRWANQTLSKAEPGYAQAGIGLASATLS
jgi:hypothetical protein